VINRQRETIYHERERILRSDDLSSTILALLEEEIRALVAEQTAGEFAAEWNREGLRSRLLAIVPTLPINELNRIDELTDGGQIAEELIELLRAAYEAKRAEIGSTGAGVLERLVLLRVIDSLWVEHLTAIDDMRRGIGLRAYSQRDPLDEFKREAYGMFDELKATIRHDVTHTIFRVTIAREPVPARPRRMLESRPEVAAGVAGGVASATAAASVGATITPRRIPSLHERPKIVWAATLTMELAKRSDLGTRAPTRYVVALPCYEARRI